MDSVLFGVDYYPEQWEKTLWESDAKRMKEMGIQAVRMMEFAWVVLEPEERRYDFSLFDEVIELFSQYGLKVVLGTPTASFPAWLSEKNPLITQVDSQGIRKDFGLRRLACLNAPAYVEAVTRMVNEVALHFGKNPNILGWQVDNEIGHEGSDKCYCSHCRNRWHKWLEEKYGTVNHLDKIWGTVFWGTTYSKFSQVPVPKKPASTLHNPGLCLDYDRFSSESAVRFVNLQVEILRRNIDKKQWITTNLYPTPHSPVIDMEKLCAEMDFAGYDNYPVWGDQDEPLPYYFTSYILSYIRGLKKNGNFAVLEQFSGMQGHHGLGHLPPEKQAVLWTNQAIARGADKIFYFRWRTAPYGQEQLCYGILDPDNTDTGKYQSLSENIKKNGEIFQKLVNSEFPSEACLLYDKDNARSLKEQYLSKGLYLSPAPFMQVGYDVEMGKNYAPYALFSINADVKSVQNVELSKYRIISLPLYQMTDENFVTRLSEWVENGGTLILGWRCGARDMNNHAVKAELPGLFTDLAGIKIKRFESLNGTSVGIRMGIVPAKGDVWADLIEPLSAKPVAWYSDSRKHYKGVPCVTVNRYGKGLVYYMGTSLNPVSIFLLYRKIFRTAGLHPKFHGLGVEVVRKRTADGKQFKVVLNHNNQAKYVMGKRIPAYGMKIIEG